MIRLRDERDYNYALKLYRYQEQVAELFKSGNATEYCPFFSGINTAGYTNFI